MPAERRDIELVAGLRGGDPASYESLVRAYGPRVLATLRRYLVSEGDVADCFQETFVAVFEKIETFHGESSLSAWIRSIAVNQCLMKLRWQKRRREQPIDDLLPVYDASGRRVEAPCARPMDPESTVESNQTTHYVRAAISRLPDKYRTVLLLRDIEGYSTREAAVRLGITPETVKVRLHRARQALKTLLEPLIRADRG